MEENIAETPIPESSADMREVESVEFDAVTPLDSNYFDAIKLASVPNPASAEQRIAELRKEMQDLSSKRQYGKAEDVRTSIENLKETFTSDRKAIVQSAYRNALSLVQLRSEAGQRELKERWTQAWKNFHQTAAQNLESLRLRQENEQGLFDRAWLAEIDDRVRNHPKLSRRYFHQRRIEEALGKQERFVEAEAAVKRTEETFDQDIKIYQRALEQERDRKRETLLESHEKERQALQLKLDNQAERLKEQQERETNWLSRRTQIETTDVEETFRVQFRKLDLPSHLAPNIDKELNYSMNSSSTTTAQQSPMSISGRYSNAIPSYSVPESPPLPPSSLAASLPQTVSSNPPSATQQEVSYAEQLKQQQQQQQQRSGSVDNQPQPSSQQQQQQPQSQQQQPQSQRQQDAPLTPRSIRSSDSQYRYISSHVPTEVEPPLSSLAPVSQVLAKSVTSPISTPSTESTVYSQLVSQQQPAFSSSSPRPQSAHPSSQPHHKQSSNQHQHQPQQAVLSPRPYSAVQSGTSSPRGRPMSARNRSPTYHLSTFALPNRATPPGTRPASAHSPRYDRSRERMEQLLGGASSPSHAHTHVHTDLLGDDLVRRASFTSPGQLAAAGGSRPHSSLSYRTDVTIASDNEMTDTNLSGRYSHQRPETNEIGINTDSSPTHSDVAVPHVVIESDTPLRQPPPPNTEESMMAITPISYPASPSRSPFRQGGAFRDMSETPVPEISLDDLSPEHEQSQENTAEETETVAVSAQQKEEQNPSNESVTVTSSESVEQQQEEQNPVLNEGVPQIVSSETVERGQEEEIPMTPRRTAGLRRPVSAPLSSSVKTSSQSDLDPSQPSAAPARPLNPEVFIPQLAEFLEAQAKRLITDMMAQVQAKIAPYGLSTTSSHHPQSETEPQHLRFTTTAVEGGRGITDGISAEEMQRKLQAQMEEQLRLRQQFEHAAVQDVEARLAQFSERSQSGTKRRTTHTAPRTRSRSRSPIKTALASGLEVIVPFVPPGPRPLPVEFHAFPVAPASGYPIASLETHRHKSPAAGRKKSRSPGKTQSSASRPHSAVARSTSKPRSASSSRRASASVSSSHYPNPQPPPISSRGRTATTRPSSSIADLLPVSSVYTELDEAKDEERQMAYSKFIGSVGTMDSETGRPSTASSLRQKSPSRVTHAEIPKRSGSATRKKADISRSTGLLAAKDSVYDLHQPRPSHSATVSRPVSAKSSDVSQSRPTSVEQESRKTGSSTSVYVPRLNFHGKGGTIMPSSSSSVAALPSSRPSSARPPSARRLVPTSSSSQSLVSAEQPSIRRQEVHSSVPAEAKRISSAYSLTGEQKNERSDYGMYQESLGDLHHTPTVQHFPSHSFPSPSTTTTRILSTAVSQEQQSASTMGSETVRTSTSRRPMSARSRHSILDELSITQPLRASQPLADNTPVVPLSASSSRPASATSRVSSLSRTGSSHHHQQQQTPLRAVEHTTALLDALLSMSAQLTT